MFCSWDPCFATVRWKLQDSHLAIAVRPSQPYRDWVHGEPPPLHWAQAVDHLDRQLDGLRPNRAPRMKDASSSTDVLDLVIPYLRPPQS